MILEEMYNGRFYPCETVVADSPRFKQAVKASAALMDTLSERLSKEDYALVEELREQVAIAQCEENESHFKYGFSAGLRVQQEAHAQVSQKDKNSIFNRGCSQTGNNHHNRMQLYESHLPINRRMAFLPLNFTSAYVWGWPGKWRQRWMKAGTRIFTTICGWRWTSTAVSSAACVC